MKTIDLEFVNIRILDNQTVLVEAAEGVEINRQKASQVNDIIRNELPDKYGMIIYRKADYSIVPLDVYEVLNNNDRLMAIAIVNERSREFLPRKIEEKLFNGEMQSFGSVSAAHQWILRTV